MERFVNKKSRAKASGKCKPDVWLVGEGHTADSKLKHYWEKVKLISMR